MAPDEGVTPAALVWLFGDEEVVGTGRVNVRVPAGVEVDELALATAVVVRALWGLSRRDLVRVAPPRKRRFLGARSPLVHVVVLGDARDATVEGVLLGLLHGRAPVGRVARRV